MKSSDTQFYLSVLRSDQCQCGRNKQSRRALCYRCWKELPEDMQKALYQRLRNGFEEAYEEAVKWLN